MTGSLEADGFCIAPGVLDKGAVTDLIAVLDRSDMTRSKRKEEIFGARNLLSVPEISTLASSQSIAGLVRPVLGDSAIPIRGIFFDKTPGANWPVAWHQDLTLAVASRRETEGWTNWTIKGGAHHANPPVSVLENILTLRIMLDDCNTDNGPLRVLPGSHRLGRLGRDQIFKKCAAQLEHVCLAQAGDVLMMRPLLLHASSAAQKPLHRRVVHIEYAAAHVIPEDFVTSLPSAVH